VETSELSTGTPRPYPMTVPAIAPIAGGAASIPAEPIDLTQEYGAQACVLPLSVVAQEPPPANTLPQKGSALEHLVHISAGERTPRSHREEVFGKNEIAELNAFLAHAQRIERPEMRATKFLENLRHPKGFEGVGNRGQRLWLLAAACSFSLLLFVGWFPTRSAGTLFVAPASTKSAVPSLAMPRVPHQRLRSRRALGSGNGLIAQDRIVRLDGGPLSEPHPQPPGTSLIQPVAIEPSAINNKRTSNLK
jgi:hypothetical protein